MVLGDPWVLECVNWCWRLRGFQSLVLQVFFPFFPLLLVFPCPTFHWSSVHFYLFFFLFFTLHSHYSLILSPVNSSILLNSCNWVFQFGYLLFNFRILIWLLKIFFFIYLWYSLFMGYHHKILLYSFKLVSFSSLNTFIILAFKSVSSRTSGTSQRWFLLPDFFLCKGCTLLFLYMSQLFAGYW